MSTTESNRATSHSARPTTDRPAAGADRPTATFPTSQWLADQAAHRQRLADLWEDATPTELLPTVPGPIDGQASASRPPAAPTAALTAFPEVGISADPAPACGSTLPEPTGGREALDSARGPRQPRTMGLRRHPHLHRALAGVLAAVALLTGMQLYAAQGISSARQAALQSARTRARAHAYSTPSDAAPETGGASPAPMSEQTPNVRSDIQPSWVAEDTHAAYNRTDPAASPLSLPRCTTSPDTPLPCLATISPDSRRAVVLEEDTSLTALVRR